MVTILLLTLVSFKAYPLKIWSSKTISPESTWEGIGNKLSQSNWKPANHIATFLGRPGAMLFKLKLKQNQIIATHIDSSLNGRVLNSTNIPKTYVLLHNNGTLEHTADGKKSIIYSSSKTAPLWAPIKLMDKGYTRCVTAWGSNNAVITFDPCNRESRQQWRLAKDGSILNRVLNSCLDISADNSPQSNTCNPEKATQKWSWEDGYLRNETDETEGKEGKEGKGGKEGKEGKGGKEGKEGKEGKGGKGGKGKCLKVKSAKGDSWSSEISDCNEQSGLTFGTLY
jgi:hypothetical protein